MSEVRLSSFWKSSILLKSVTCSFSSSGRLSSWGRDFGFPLRLRNINNYEDKTHYSSHPVAIRHFPKPI